MRLAFFALFMVLAACANREPLSPQAERIAALAEERKQEERFPILRALPDSPTDDGSTIDPGVQGQLQLAAQDLTPVRSQAEQATSDTQLSVEEVAAELLTEIDRLRAQQGLPPSTISREDLRFPTPPPLEN